MRRLSALLTIALPLAAPLSALASELVYIPLGSAGEVLVVEAASGRAVRTIGDLPDVHGLALAAKGAYLVAGSYAEWPREAAGAPPKPATVSKDEHEAHHAKPVGLPAAAGSKAVSFVSVVRPDDGAILRRVEVPGAVHHLVGTPDGRYAVATHPNADGISVIDLAGFTVARMVKTGPLPNYAAVSPNGGRLYVSNAGNDTVSEIDTQRWIVRRNFVAGASPEHLLLSADGETLYVANVDAGTVSEIDTRSGEIKRTLDIGGSVHGIDLSEDGGTLFVSGRGENKVVAVDLGTGGLRGAPLGPSPYHLAVVPGTGKLYVSSAEEPTVWVIDQRSLRVISTLAIRGEGHQMAIAGR
ncbi:MAG: YncE family protein [Proteobacteria bacterium]|nr:YncE family protein [Pseudomonadota bacterium]